KQGQAVINKFHNEVPFIRELAQKVERKAKNVGTIVTLLGRHIHFTKDELGNFEWTYKALNRLIQGGSADQMKKAMVIADQLGIKMQLQVHDELDFSSRSPAERAELAQAMRDAVPLLVPSVVDEESGDSWGEINEEGRVQCQEFYGAAA
ncbi:MAG: DNA polymerase, partial [Candidatus Thorarchaeota archaeon]